MFLDINKRYRLLGVDNDRVFEGYVLDDVLLNHSFGMKNNNSYVFAGIVFDINKEDMIITTETGVYKLEEIFTPEQTLI